MKNISLLSMILVMTLFAGNALAWDPPASPKPASAILDLAGQLNTSSHQRLDAKLVRINQNTANEFAALILPSLEGENIRDVAFATAKAWGVGKKDHDNGVMVVLAMKEHQSSIETGKGVEGDLPDLKCSDILQGARPFLRKNDIEGALNFIFTSAADSISSHKNVKSSPTLTDSSNPTVSQNHVACSVGNVGSEQDVSLLASSIILGLLFVFATVAFFVRRHQRNKIKQKLDDVKRSMNLATPLIAVPVVNRTHFVAASSSVALSHKHTVSAPPAPITYNKTSAHKTHTPATPTPSYSSSSSDSGSSSSSDSGSSSFSTPSFGGGGSDDSGFGGGDFGGGGASNDW